MRAPRDLLKRTDAIERAVRERISLMLDRAELHLSEEETLQFWEEIFIRADRKSPGLYQDWLAYKADQAERLAPIEALAREGEGLLDLYGEVIVDELIRREKLKEGAD